MGEARPEVVWYRLHIKVAPGQQGLALEEWNLAQAFEIYADGVKILQCGKVAPFVPSGCGARLVTPIPQAAQAANVVLALRVRLAPEDWMDRNPGLFYTNLALGQEQGLQEHIWLTEIGSRAAAQINHLFDLGLALVALALYLSQRDRREYLWLFILGLDLFLYLPWTIFRDLVNFPVVWRLIDAPLQVVSFVAFLMVYLSFLRVRPTWWMRVCIWLAAVTIVADVVTLYALHHNVQKFDLGANFLIAFFEGGVILILCFMEWRKGNGEAGILLIPTLIYSFAEYAAVTVRALLFIPSLYDRVNHISELIFSHQFGPFTVSIYDIGNLLFLLTLTIIIVLRSTQSSRQQALLEGELAAAAEVQQVIVPEQVEKVPGFKVETAYIPAQQVGGDFFQVLPAKDGGLLLVVGDVAGKGLPAAMLVSVMVGAVRGVAVYTQEPAELLANLNERLVGRTHGGFSTALVAHIAADGMCRVANAGHLSPYMDGREVALPGALPLGLVSGVVYETTQFAVPPGSRLTLYSDGVVEAMNAKRELLGFERARAISTDAASAIAETARSFGQQDDITVITVERVGSIAAAA